MLNAIAATLVAYSPATWTSVAFLVFAAGFLRGYTGFGFGLAVVPALTLFLPPTEVVPATLIVAMVVGVRLLPKAWSQADWSSIRLLSLGALVGTPVGAWALKSLPADPMRIVIGLICLAAVLLLWRGFKLQVVPRRRVRLTLGVASGLLNGATAMGGPPVIIFFLALPSGIVVGRASLFIFFFFSAVTGVAIQAVGGLVTWRVIVLSVLMYPLMAIGNALGDRRFDKSSEGGYRLVALLFLLAIALIAIVRPLVGLIT
jgi:uncharacterized membrane protein YfcA